MDRLDLVMSTTRRLPDVDGFITNMNVEPSISGALIKDVDDVVYRYDGHVGFPQPPSVSWDLAKFFDFLQAHQTDPFLVMSTRLHARRKTETFVATAGQTDFLIEKRYPEDGHGVSATKDGAPLVHGVEAGPQNDYFLKTDDVNPFYRLTTAANAGETYVFTYLFWIPVLAINDPFSDYDQLVDPQFVEEEAPALKHLIVQETEPFAHISAAHA